MVLLEGWFAISGIALVTWLEFGLYYVKNSSVNWRFPIALQALFILVVVGAVLLLPESPRWLVRRDRLEEAAETLSKLQDVTPDSPEVSQNIENIRHSLAEDVSDTAGGVSSSPFARTKNRHLHRTILAIGVNILAQMSGVNIITFYSDTIFETDLGYSGTLSRIITGCLQLWQMCAAGLAIFLVDRFGRRVLLITAAAGMTIAQACLAGLSSDLSNKSAASASLLFYFIALFSFPIGLFLVPFMYAAEIAPLRVRAKVTAMSAASNWLFNFLLAEVTPIGFASIGYRYYIVYACISAFACVCFTLFYPETRGRTLEEIDEIFEQSKTIFDPVRIARQLPFQSKELEAIKNQEKKDTVELVEEAGATEQ